MGYKLNVFTGTLDLVGDVPETVNIVTNFCNPFGAPIKFYDPELSVYYVADDMVVTDNDGNVVIT